MATIETKYSVGDTVWYAGTTTEAKQHPCPDCKDTKKWSATSPAGNEYSFACPRCAKSFSSYDGISLKYTAHVATAEMLTIGSVQYNSASGSYDHGARYMCRETGIGSGRVYDEAKLFIAKDDALAAAKIMADKANATIPHVVEQFNKTLDIADYELESALLKEAQDAARKARSLVWNLNDLFEQVGEAETKDDIIELVDDYKQYRWKRDKEASAAAPTETLPLADDLAVL